MSFLDALLWFQIACLMWVLIGIGGIMLIAKLTENKSLPHCDIDPRCHHAFAIDKAGQAWIGGAKLERW
jgi:hypothetical protein